MKVANGGRTHDVALTGPTFFDLVMSGLDAAPRAGTEVYAGHLDASPGGIANLAVATARLGLSTALATTLGDDIYGRWCHGVLGDVEGVDLSRTRVRESWPTPVTLSVAHDGDRSMITREEPTAALDPLHDGMAPRAAIADLNALQGNDAGAWWRRAARDGTRIFADAGWDSTGAWRKERLRPLEHCFAFTPNAGEAMAYTGADTPEDAARALAELVPLVVVTRGAGGAVAIDSAAGTLADVAGVPVVARDTTGAGDVFQAALCWGILEELSLEDAVSFAVLTSALATTAPGGAAASPCWGDIAAWRERHHDKRFAFVDDLLVDVQRPLQHRADRRTPFARFREGRELSGEENDHAST